MSQRALALGGRDHLRNEFGWEPLVCDVTRPPGKPPAACGELFIAVWENGCSNGATESRQDVHSMNVTITRRIPFSPHDREAEEVIHKIEIGLEVLADRIAGKIHGSYTIMDLANAYIGGVYPGDDVYVFSEPLRYLNTTRTEEKNGDWFWGDPNHKDAGRSITLYFGRAHRQQSLFNQK